MKNILVIEFDGGCRPTNPGNRYGSFQVTRDQIEILRADRKQLGWGTNNEAEFETLILALTDLKTSLVYDGLEPDDSHVIMVTDSTIVLNRIKGLNQNRSGEPQKRMFLLARRCLNLLKAFHSWEIMWESRKENVARFGH